MNLRADEFGYYGDFGGAFIPEMLYPNIAELKERYPTIVESSEFKSAFTKLLNTFAGRPTPLYYAEGLSSLYNSSVFLKREDLLHTGAHKINNTIGQGLLAVQLGKRRIIAETGAGQHGVATATVCALLNLECIIYMGALDVERQQPNVRRMEMLGAKVIPVHSGSKTLKDATNEAMRDWIQNAHSTHYLIGSVVGPHPFPEMISRFHSVTSKEIEEQLLTETGREYPDAVIACVGGGSNAIGAFYHFIPNPSVTLIGVEAAGHGVNTEKTAATMTLGTPGVLHGSYSMLLQDEGGQIKEAHSISAGLDYPGVGPQHAYLSASKRATYVSVTDNEALKAAFRLSRTEGIIPALESAHALAHLEQLKGFERKTVVVNLSGRGDKDLATYSEYIRSQYEAN